MVIAGEESGDLHASSLIKAIRSLDNEIEFYGIGGDRMKQEGMTLIYHITEMAFLGFIEIIRHIPFIRKVRRDIIEFILKNKIGTVVLVDYPGFNLSLAEKLKKHKIEVIYFIAPQIWAWGKGRLNKIKKIISKVLVVFEFEKSLYKDAGIDVEFVGHPLIERLEKYKFIEKEVLYKKYNLNINKDILLIMPGSRVQEVRRIFPESIKAATLLAKEFNLEIIVLCSATINANVFNKFKAGYNFHVVNENNYDFLKYSRIGIIKSGTSTLEAGLFGLPMTVVYVTNYLTYLLGILLVKIKNIALINIVLRENVVDELIQRDVNSIRIYNSLKRILQDRDLEKSLSEKLRSVKLRLGEYKTSQKAAGIITSMMNENTRS